MEIAIENRDGFSSSRSNDTGEDNQSIEFSEVTMSTSDKRRAMRHINWQSFQDMASKVVKSPRHIAASKKVFYSWTQKVKMKNQQLKSPQKKK